jgi:hypothetical protein
VETEEVAGPEKLDTEVLDDETTAKLYLSISVAINNWKGGRRER